MNERRGPRAEDAAERQQTRHTSALSPPTRETRREPAANERSERAPGAAGKREGAERGREMGRGAGGAANEKETSEQSERATDRNAAKPLRTGRDAGAGSAPPAGERGVSGATDLPMCAPAREPRTATPGAPSVRACFFVCAREAGDASDTRRGGVCRHDASERNPRTRVAGKGREADRCPRGQGMRASWQPH